MSSRGYPVTKAMRTERATAAKLRSTVEYSKMNDDERDAVNGPVRQRRATRRGAKPGRRALAAQR